jgi:hypothetical protein
MSIRNADKKTGEISPREVKKQYQRNAVRMEVYGESKTQNNQKDETDINAIVRRYKRTGVLPNGGREPQYRDVTGLQGSDLGTVILDTRQRIDDARTKLFEDRREKAKAAAEQAEKDAAELKAFREAAASKSS